MTVPYTFATQVGPVPLAQLDANFALTGGGQEFVSILSGMTGEQQTDYLTGARTLDLTAPIAATIQASSGKFVWFPPGNAKITSRMDFSNLHDMTLAGAQYASVLGVSGIIECTTFDTTCDHLVFDGLSFAGNSVAEESKAALRSRAPFTEFKNLYVHNFNAGIIIEDENAEFCSIRHCLLKDIIGHTSGNGYATYTIGQFSNISDNIFDTVGRHDVYLSGSSPQGARFCNVMRNRSRNNYVQAIAVFNTAVVGGEVSDNNICDNIIYGAGAGGGPGTAIGLDQHAKRNRISGNKIYKPVIGIFLNGSTAANTFPNDNIIDNNTIVDASAKYIEVINGSNNDIHDNKCVKISVVPSSLRAIEITSTGAPATYPTGNKVSNNTVDPSFTQFVDVHPTTGVPYGALTTNSGTVEVIVPDGATTFDVADCSFLRLANSAPTTFAHLTSGTVGQAVTLWFTNANTTLPHGGDFYLQGGVNFVSTAASSITLRLQGAGTWLQIPGTSLA